MYIDNREELGADQMRTAEIMRPLADRIAEEKPELKDGIAKLREFLTPDVYDRSFDQVETFTKSGDMLLIVTDAMRRSFIERDCIGALKEAFGVKYVRVVA